MLPFYKDRAYQPLPPQADTDDLAAEGDRLLLQHNLGGSSPGFVVAPKGVVTFGWVIGVFK